jgi:simple sugar transport system ATP-binding protein
LPDTAGHPSQPTPSLQLESISKRFGRLQALRGVSVDFHPGRVHALLGENGAGKTTLMRIAFGMIEPDAGSIRVDNAPMRFQSPADAIRAGIGMVHQHFMLVRAMTVAENVELGGRGRYDAGSAAVRVLSIGEKTGLRLDPRAQVSSLNVAAQQRLEIIKALSRDAKILILDEPTAVLAPAEAQQLLAIVRNIALDGCTVVLITHRLEDALQYSDEVSILRHGELVLNGPTTEVTRKEIARAMIGELFSPPVVPEKHYPPNEKPVAIELRNTLIERRLASRSLTSINLQVRRGEIVGVAALDDATADLLRVIAGRFEAKSGTVITPSSIGFIPEDRLREAIISEFQLFENVALRDSGLLKGGMPWLAIRSTTRALIGRFDIRAQSVEMLAGELSGGNQQKLVLARELNGEPEALIAENPTRGLDIQAAENIKRYIREAADKGCAIMYYSSDIDELIEVSDRIMVVREGTMVEVDRSPNAIGSALLGSSLDRTADHSIT